MVDAAGEAIVVERDIEASREDVFAAFENPASMQEWFFAGECTSARVRSDFRPGGTFQIDMLEGSTTHENRGEYRLIHPPRKVVFTWVNPSVGRTLVAVELARTESGTHVRLIHQGVRDPELGRRNEEGWKRILARLSAFLAGRLGRPPAG